MTSVQSKSRMKRLAAQQELSQYLQHRGAVPKELERIIIESTPDGWLAYVVFRDNSREEHVFEAPLAVVLEQLGAIVDPAENLSPWEGHDRSEDILIDNLTGLPSL